MEEKLSIFNIYVERADGVWIYNVKNRKLYKITLNEYESLLDSKTYCLSNESLTCLRRYGMISFAEKEGDKFVSEYRNEMRSSKLNITIMADTVCNFKCVYCYEEYTPQFIDSKFATVFLKYVLDNVHLYSSLFLEWFGGEPLLAKEKLIEISSECKRICREKRRAFIGSITTNGYFLDYETFNKLILSNIIFFQITIDGEKKWHDKYRPLKNGDGTYDVIINNLLNVKNKVSKSSVFRIVIRNNINRENKESCNRFQLFFDKMFGDDQRFQLIQYPVQDWGGESIKKMTPVLVNNNNFFVPDVMNNRNDLFESTWSGSCCAAKENGFVIMPDYNVYKCNHGIQKDTNVIKENRVGFLHGNGKLIIDQEKNRLWLDRTISEECKKCVYLPRCIMQCPLKELKPYIGCKGEIGEIINKQLEKIICRLEKRR